MRTQSPFYSSAEFRRAFISGLQRLAELPELGVHILAQANAVFDEEIHHQLQMPLARRFEQLASACREALTQGRNPQAAPDDLLVFLKLMAIGLENLQLTQFRQEQEWELQYNPIRALRPLRTAGSVARGIHLPFDAEGFHFNKPFLRKEAFWSGELEGLEIELLFNKFPFVPLHGLLVPERRSEQAQFLSHPYHLYIWSLTEKLAEKLHGLGFGYNSYGAYASVNHLHFQMFQRETLLPIAAETWQHNGGNQPYPVDCECFTSVNQAWQRLEDLHADATSYNLIYTPGRLYCLPRKAQGSYVQASWTSGFAWHELAGGITTFNRNDYESIQAKDVCGEMEKLRLDADPNASIKPFDQVEEPETF